MFPFFCCSQQILVPYTDFHYRLTPDVGEEHLKSVLGFKSNHNSVTSPPLVDNLVVAHSWVDLICGVQREQRCSLPGQ